MTKRLTNEELTQIKQRAEKATEGNWRIDYGSTGNARTVSTDSYGTVCDYVTPEDADFIANSREDIPKMLAEIERLEKLVASVKSEIGHALYSKKSTGVKRFYLENAIRYIDRDTGGDTE